jgi:MFS family permease
MLLAFRALQGISISLCLTTAVDILSGAFEKGGRRNVAFAGMGAASPVGYTVGLVLGGVFVEGPGRRWSHYLAAILNVVIFGAAAWVVPADKVEDGRGNVWGRLGREIDWVGAKIATVGISLLSYVMA